MTLTFQRHAILDAKRRQAGSVKVKTDPVKKAAASDKPAHRDCLSIGALCGPFPTLRAQAFSSHSEAGLAREGTALRLPCKHKRPSQRLSSPWFSERLPRLLFPQITQPKVTLCHRSMYWGAEVAPLHQSILCF